MKKIILLISFLLIFSLIGCQGTDDTVEDVLVSTVVPVEVSNPESGSVSNDTVIIGKLEANDVAYVSAKIPGVEDILEVHVEVGDVVNEGDVLVVLDSESTSDQIEASRLAYVTAKRNYDALAESIETSKANLERTKELYASGVASKQQLEGAELQASDAQLKTVQSQLSQSYFAYENAKKSLDNIVLISPIEGIISTMGFKENNVATGQSSITITDITTLKINLSVTENIINKINNETKILVKIESAGDELVESTIEHINPVADARTGLYNVVINIENVNNIYKPGMFARVFVTIESNDFALLVPIDSVMNDDDSNYVFTVVNEKVVRKNVEIGIDNGEVVEILNGLSLEDLIIVKGQNFINEDSDIRVVVGGN